VNAKGLVARSVRNPHPHARRRPYARRHVHNAVAACLNEGRAVFVFRSHTATCRSILGYAKATKARVLRGRGVIREVTATATHGLIVPPAPERLAGLDGRLA
jgi:hypothetical protein